MNIFGITPVDAALSALGLNCAQMLADAVFTHTRIAQICMICGVLFAAVRAARHADYRSLIMVAMVYAAIVLLFLPKKDEGRIASAAEVYSTSPHAAHSIKNLLTSHHHVPSILSWLAQVADSFVIGVIHVTDSAMVPWARFLAGPFQAELLCLDARGAVRSHALDAAWQAAWVKFLRDHYVPALSMIKHDKPDVDLSALWPGHRGVTVYYSTSARKEWADLQPRLTAVLDGHPHVNARARNTLAQISGTSPDAVREGLIAAMARQSADTRPSPHTFFDIFHASGMILRFFPILYGWCHLILYAAFPLVVLIVAVSLKATALRVYGALLAGVKAMALWAALCGYGAAALASLQVQSALDASWVWERPYFCVAAAVGLVIMPVLLTLTLMARSGIVRHSK